MIDTEKLKQELAKKNGLIIHDDDPIIAAHISNQLLFQEYEKKLDATISSQRDKHEDFFREASQRFDKSIKDISVKWGDETRQTAEKAVTITLEAGRKAIREEIKKGEIALQTLMREQIGALITEREKFVKSQGAARSQIIPCLIFGCGLTIGALAEYIAFKGIPFT